MKYIAIILNILLLGTLFSCNKILDKYPLSGPSTSTFLASEEELELAVTGAYSNLWLNSISASGQWEYILDNATDIGWDRNGSVLTFVGNGSHTPSTTNLSTVWDQFYKGIASANYILDNLNRVEDADEQTLDYADGQARFLRAYWYSQLVTLWGDVPFVLHVQTLEETQVAKTPQSDIIDYLLKDLDTAAMKLPVSWPSADLGRATQGAALALKSRLALIDSRFDVAAAAAKAVMDMGAYELYPDYEKLFKYAGENTNKEIIFQVDYQYGLEVHRMPIAIFSRNAGGNSTKVPTQSMVDSYECTDGLTIDQSPLYDPAHPFENRDPRLKQTIAVPGDTYLGYQFETYDDSTQCWNYNVTPAVRITNQDVTNPYATFSGYCWRKTADSADLGNYRSASSLNFILIRYAEVLLNYAEAKIELNQIDASCLDAINQVRSRPTVNMPPISSGKSQSEMRTIIRRERKIELAMEGLRLQDIRRWHIAEKVMPGPLYGRPQKPYNYTDQKVPSIDADGYINYSSYSDKLSIIETRIFDPNKDYLWPIPQSEIDVNKLLEQNKGY